MSIVNERMRDLRRMSDVTLLDMAKRIGVSEATVQRYESGKIEKVPYKAIIEYAKAFNVVPEYIMGWVENKHQKELNIFDLANNKEAADKTREDKFRNQYELQEPIDITLTKEEYIIIEGYRKLDHSQKELVKRAVLYEEGLNRSVTDSDKR